MAQLKEAAGGDPRSQFKDPVPYSDLVTTLNQYDLGLSILPLSTFKLAWCLPNKSFDYVQARLGGIAGPSPEMVRFVEEFEIGLVLEDFEPRTLSVALEQLSREQVSGFGAAAHHHAERLPSDS